jgi:hypothetical protein
MSPKRKPKAEVTFDPACSRIEAILKGPFRQDVLAGLSKTKSVPEALARLGDGMRAHRFLAGAQEIDLGAAVRSLDARNRQEGFHVLQDWDGKADRLNTEIIPVDVLDFLKAGTTSGKIERGSLAILLDYYFFYVLALLSLRIWDEGSPDENLDRLDRALRDLSGPRGSGQKFVATAETLVPVATSHFETDVKAYERLLEKVKRLSEPHRRRFALVYAGILASHLRFGFEATYGRDVTEMRKDNEPDYPWLSFALSTLMSAYSRMEEGGIRGMERDRIVEGLLNGLTPDPRAFVGVPPASLSAQEEERSEFSRLFRRHQKALLEEFELQRPSERDYSPISFFFNFSHNLIKGMVVDAVLRGTPWSLTLDDLLTGFPRDDGVSESKKRLAQVLMGYARSSRDTIRGRPVPAVVYDPRSGRRAFADAIQRATAPS